MKGVDPDKAITLWGGISQLWTIASATPGFINNARANLSEVWPVLSPTKLLTLAALLIRVVILCVVPIVAMLGGNIILFTSQGIDFILDYGTAFHSHWYTTTEAPSVPLLLGALLIWSVTVWFCARYLIKSEPNYFEETKTSWPGRVGNWISLVLPRVLGLCCIAPLGLAISSIILTQSELAILYDRTPFLLLMLGGALAAEVALNRDKAPPWFDWLLAILCCVLIGQALFAVSYQIRNASRETVDPWRLTRPLAGFLFCLSGFMWFAQLSQKAAPGSSSRPTSILKTVAAATSMILGVLLLSLAWVEREGRHKVTLEFLEADWPQELGLLIALLFAVLYALFGWGRTFFPILFRHFEGEGHKDWTFGLVFLVSSIGLIALTVWTARDPVAVGQLLAPIPLILFAISTLVVCLTFLFLHMPSGSRWLAIALPVGLFLLSSTHMDNHVLPDVLPPARADGRHERQDLKTHFTEWQRKGQSSEEAPVFIVAAAGGGIRAAAWTAFTLALLDDMTCDQFGKHLYLVTAVSGGSLGAALYVSGRREVALQSVEDGAKCWDEYRNFDDGRPGLLARFFEKDSASPLLASMLFADLLQRFSWESWLTRDRGWALEKAWETNWAGAMSEMEGEKNHLSQPFMALYGEDRIMDTPLLVLNATSVESGRRVFTSPVELAAFDGLDLFGPNLVTGNMRLSTAVHNSARFTYVSPAGLVFQRKSNETIPWGRVVDGGYFENSGTASAREIAQQLIASGKVKRPNLYAIILSNEPRERNDRICRYVRRNGKLVLEPTARAPQKAVVGHSEGLSDLLSPMQTMLAAREARGAFSELQLAKLLGCDHVFEVFLSKFETPKHDRRGNISSVSRIVEARDAPLGWYLSRVSLETLKSALTRDDWQDDQPVQFELERIAATVLDLPNRGLTQSWMAQERHKFLCDEAGIGEKECRDLVGEF